MILHRLRYLGLGSGWPDSPALGYATGQHGSMLLVNDPMGMAGAYLPVPPSTALGSASILDMPVHPAADTFCTDLRKLRTGGRRPKPATARPIML